MEKKMMFVLAVCLGLAGLCHAGYTDWQDGHDGSEAGTIALWHFEDPYALYGDWKCTTEEVNGNANQARIAAWSAAHPSDFTTPGKWGFGAHGSSTTGNDIYVDGSHVAGALWPDGSDPSLSVEAWVMLNDPENIGGWAHLIDRQYAEKIGFNMRLEDIGSGGGLLSPRFFVGDGTNVLGAYGSAVLFEPGVWYHIAGTWDAATDQVKVYRDGALLDTQTYAGSSIVQGGTGMRFTVRLGASGGLDGAIDEVRFSDIAHDYDIPEPTTMALLALGSFAMLKRKR